MATDDELMLARNIVNQLGELWCERILSAEWVHVRQATNDLADEFVSGLIHKHTQGVFEAGRREGAETTTQEIAVWLDSKADGHWHAIELLEQRLGMDPWTAESTLTTETGEPA